MTTQTGPRQRLKALAIALPITALLGVVAWVNYLNLLEAYGSGPPYYGRTTNMDKWTNPLPALLILDAVACGALLALGVIVRRRQRRS